MNFIPNTKEIEKLTVNDIVNDTEIQKKIDALHKTLETKPNDIDTLLHLAFYYLQGHDDSNAIKMYKKVLELDPNNVDACIWFSEFFIFTWADDEAAIPLLEHALKIDPSRADVYYLLACAFNTQNNTEKEKYYLIKSVELKPKWITPRWCLISLLIKNKEFKTAKEELEKLYSYIDENFPTPADGMEEYYESLITGRLVSNDVKKTLKKYQETIDQN